MPLLTLIDNPWEPAFSMDPPPRARGGYKEGLNRGYDLRRTIKLTSHLTNS
jgi:hypothetical protein